MRPYQHLTHAKSKDFIDIRLQAKKGWTYKPKYYHCKVFRLSMWTEFAKMPSLQHRQHQKLMLKLRARKLDDEDLKQIGRSFRSTKAVKVMLVDLRMSDEFSNFGLKYLSRQFATLKALSVLSFCLKKCYTINDDGATFLTKNLSKAKALRSLNLDLEFIPKITDTFMLDIDGCLSHLKLLRNFQLNVHQSSVTTLGASCVGQSISHLSQLKSVTLDFSRCNLDDEIFTTLSNTLTEASRLESFHFWCNYVDELTGRGLVTLSETLSSLQTIKDVRLYFYNCDKISTENLCNMSNIIKVQEPAKLGLSFYGADFVDLFDLVSYLPNLIELQLILNNWQTKGEPSIPKGFLATSHRIQKLYITFENCFEVGDAHVAILADEISQLKQLNLLHMVFFGCDISKEGMLRCLECLSDLRNLEDLRLYFERRVVSKEMISNLSSYLANMNRMKTLDITFFCASFLDDEDLMSLADSLSKMEELSLLLFNLTGCKEIRDAGIKYLVSSLSTLKSLKGLKMDLRGLPELTFEGLDDLVDLFAKFSNLIKGRVLFNGNFLTPRFQEKFAMIIRFLPKLVCFYLNHQNISVYKHGNLSLFPEYWFTPTF